MSSPWGMQIGFFVTTPENTQPPESTPDTQNPETTLLARPGFKLRTLNDVVQVGTLLHQSGNFKNNVSAQAAVAKVLAGLELGLGPFAAMSNLLVIDGKVTLSAALVGGLIKSHPKYDYRVITHSDQECTIQFTQEGTELGQSSFTMADAQQAGLIRPNSPWQKYPRNMVLARALTNGARWYCPDVFNGPIYTPDELGANLTVDAEGDEHYTVVNEIPMQAPTPAAPPAQAIEQLLAAPPVPAAPTFSNNSSGGEGAFGDPVNSLRNDGTPWPVKPEQTECPLHPKFWFNKIGTMKSFAHAPADDGGLWCNRAEALQTFSVAQTNTIAIAKEVQEFPAVTPLITNLDEQQERLPW